MATGSSSSHSTIIGQAQVEHAVQAALQVQGRHFDREDITAASQIVMAGLSPQQRIAIATDPGGNSHLLQSLIPSATARVAIDKRAGNVHSTTGGYWSGTGRTRFGAGVAGYYSTAAGGGDGDADGGDGPRGYSLMSSKWSSDRPGDLHAGNWRDSPFSSVAGLDMGTARSLLAAGYRTNEIVAAGRALEDIARGFPPSSRAMLSTPENIARVTRLNRHAPGFMPQFTAYAERMAAIREGLAGVAQDEARLREMEARGEGGSEAATTLRESVERRRLEFQRQEKEEKEKMDQTIHSLPQTRIPGGSTPQEEADKLRKEHDDAHGAKVNELNVGAATAGARAVTSQAEAAAVQARPGTTAADDTFGDDAVVTPTSGSGQQLPQSGQQQAHVNQAGSGQAGTASASASTATTVAPQRTATLAAPRVG